MKTRTRITLPADLAKWATTYARKNAMTLSDLVEIRLLVLRAIKGIKK